MTFVTIGLLFVCSCRRQETFDIAGTKQRAVLTFALTHDTAAGTTPSPVLHVTLNGADVRLIVDTGATSHAITKWLAGDLGIPTTTHTDDIARDFVGAPLEVARSTPLLARANGTVVIRGVVPVVETPMLDRARGIGGVFAPPLLLPPGHSVVLDLVHDKLGVVATELGDSVRLGPRKSLTPTGMRSCGIAGIYIVPAKIGGADVMLRLDTGSEQTTVFTTSTVGTMLSPKASATGEPVAHVELHAGNFTRELPVRLVPAQISPRCPYDGLLGMDVLANCQIVVDQKRGIAECDN